VQEVEKIQMVGEYTFKKRSSEIKLSGNLEKLRAQMEESPFNKANESSFVKDDESFVDVEEDLKELQEESKSEVDKEPHDQSPVEASYQSFVSAGAELPPRKDSGGILKKVSGESNSKMIEAIKARNFSPSGSASE